MLRKLLLASLALLSFAASASATWSICVVNRRTGEVAVAGATCIANIDLMSSIPVIRVGQGAGCIQSAGWEPGLVLIYDLLGAGATPTEILSAIRQATNEGNLQIGIAGMIGDPVAFSGGAVGRAKGSRVGTFGDYSYAISGNVLTGSPVWIDCRDALVGTPGDMAEKVMAAMEAAYLAGGDGRCSCDDFRPTSCGSPPPNFTKSAHCGFMIVSRIGDTDPPCLIGSDCARPGSYYLKINIRDGNAAMNDPDPVLQIRDRYDAWRANRVGLPDAVLSTVSSVQSLPADGLTQRTVRVRLRDIDGTDLSAGGDDVQVATLDGAPSAVGVSAVTDHGDGTYSFTLTAGTTPGTDELVITAQADNRRVTLYPYLEVRSDPVQPLHAGFETVRVMDGADVPFVLNLPGNAGDSYLVLASLSGTTPGTTVGGVVVPLNTDNMTWATLLRAGDPRTLPGSVGSLDGSGRAEMGFTLGPNQLLYLSGLHVDWAGLVFGSAASVATNAVGFDILP